MRTIFKVFLFICSWLMVRSANAQQDVQTTPLKEWKAYWIAAPDDAGTAYGIYYFRKAIMLDARPAAFKVKVSADNRYKLFVNGTLVSLGPARGDTYYWNYETVDLAPYLQVGKNVIAALVWNEAEHRPEAQISLRTGFILQGVTAAEEILNTGKTWKCIRDKAYTPLEGIGYGGYYVAGPGEMVDMSKTIKGWMNVEFDDSRWTNAAALDHGKPKGLADAFGWMLVPSAIPQMQLTNQRIPVLRKAEGVTVPASFPKEKTAVTIPPGTIATLLLDQMYLTNAYFNLQFSKGAGAGISITYAEAPFDNLKKTGTKKATVTILRGRILPGEKTACYWMGAIINYSLRCISEHIVTLK